MKIRVLAYAALLSLSVAGGARADAVDSIQAIPPDVGAGQTTIAEGTADVTTAGPGRRQGQTGLYRVIVFRSPTEAGEARLFVQWVAGKKVANSLEIKEFAALKTDVTGLTAKMEQGDLSVFIDVTPKAGEKLSYELFVHGPQKYRFGKASN